MMKSPAAPHTNWPPGEASLLDRFHSLGGCRPGPEPSESQGEPCWADAWRRRWRGGRQAGRWMPRKERRRRGPRIWPAHTRGPTTPCGGRPAPITSAGNAASHTATLVACPRPLALLAAPACPTHNGRATRPCLRLRAALLSCSAVQRMAVNRVLMAQLYRRARSRRSSPGGQGVHHPRGARRPVRNQVISPRT